MSKEQIDILDMQCWLVRLAQKKGGLSGAECMRTFKDNDVLGFTEGSYGVLHLSGYEQALADVEEYIFRDNGNAVSCSALQVRPDRFVIFSVCEKAVKEHGPLAGSERFAAEGRKGCARFRFGAQRGLREVRAAD